MKTSTACALTALIFSLPALAGDKLPDLGGTYRVRGECYERTERDEYKRCVAWNQLVLKPDTVDGSYRYILDTNTFATTHAAAPTEVSSRASLSPSSWLAIATPTNTCACAWSEMR